MKKIVVWYICLFVALGCFMNFLGINNVGFDSALHKAVNFINGIGDVSQAALKFIFGVDDVVVEGLEELPYSYRKAYTVLQERHAGHDPELCPFSDADSLIMLVRSQFCSDLNFYLENKNSTIYRQAVSFVNSRMRDGANHFVNLFRLGKIPDALMEKLTDLYLTFMDLGCDDTMRVGDFFSVADTLDFWRCLDK